MFIKFYEDLIPNLISRLSKRFSISLLPLSVLQMSSSSNTVSDARVSFAAAHSTLRKSQARFNLAMDERRVATSSVDLKAAKAELISAGNELARMDALRNSASLTLHEVDPDGDVIL